MLLHDDDDDDDDDDDADDADDADDDDDDDDDDDAPTLHLLGLLARCWASAPSIGPAGPLDGQRPRPKAASFSYTAARAYRRPMIRPRKTS